MDEKTKRRAPPQYQHHVYGRGAAFEVYDTVNPQGVRVVGVDCAKALDHRRYDWGNKVIFMTTLDEMSQYVAVVLGMSRGVEFKYHGPAKDKTMAIRWDDSGNLLLEMRATGFGALIRIQTTYDRLAISSLFLRMLAENLNLTISEVHLQLQSFYDCKTAGWQK